MVRYKCLKCGGNQYSSSYDKEKEPCIYCGNPETKIQETLDEISGQPEQRKENI